MFNLIQQPYQHNKQYFVNNVIDHKISFKNKKWYIFVAMHVHLPFHWNKIKCNDGNQVTQKTKLLPALLN